MDSVLAGLMTSLLVKNHQRTSSRHEDMLDNVSSALDLFNGP
jgi:hypothetical protein